MLKIIILMGILSSIFGCDTPHLGGNATANDTITYFSLSQGGGMRRFGGYKYCVEKTKEGRAHFLFNEGYPDEKEFTIDDLSVFDSLQQIVLKHKMHKYSGHYEPKMRVFDGESWSLHVKYASRKTISAGGYVAGPDGYRKAFEDIQKCLDQWKETSVETNEVVSFTYNYGTKRYHIERQAGHASVTIDDETAERHETMEKPLEMMEELRVMAITENLRENSSSKSDNPDSTPFKFDIVFSNGSHYVYESYDLSYKCHYTEVIHYFLSRWEIDTIE